MLKNKNYNNREKNKGSNIALKSRGQADVFQMFEDVILEKGFKDMEDEMLSPNAVMATMPIIMNATIDLTKLVIDNRVRNSAQMTDQDVYQIHREAFKHISKVFEE